MAFLDSRATPQVVLSYAKRLLVVWHDYPTGGGRAPTCPEWVLRDGGSASLKVFSSGDQLGGRMRPVA